MTLKIVGTVVGIMLVIAALFIFPVKCSAQSSLPYTYGSTVMDTTEATTTVGIVSLGNSGTVKLLSIWNEGSADLYVSVNHADTINGWVAIPVGRNITLGPTKQPWLLKRSSTGTVRNKVLIQR